MSKVNDGVVEQVRIPPSLAPSKDSLSLWNFSLSPGWTKEEVRVLSLCLMSFGVGRWQKIVDSGYLPNKTISQLNLQTQRLIGQQSVAEFTGLCIDPAEVREHNEQRIAQGAKTKGGIIVNTGPNPTKEIIMSRLKENSKKFGLKEEQIAVAKAQLLGIVEGQKMQRNLDKFSTKTRQQAVSAILEQTKDGDKKQLCVDKDGLQLYSLEEKSDKDTHELRKYWVKLMNTLHIINETIHKLQSEASSTEEKNAMQDITNVDTAKQSESVHTNYHQSSCATKEERVDSSFSEKQGTKRRR
ncbi:hypothetical protein Gasu2_67360 [Galdieria sulphuraria]|uniref:Myb-like domain-containing protein n=1 Tax=Galdieria sulphuraria TaxID=130081 RepID=M2XRB9_GALSU|nr:uncharacterized protein Gasu_01470 [Galdieria sulphuraria]EME32787.1 hypothetical protein Gasu_01470 [Galdieria sulphuraria]GJD12662.1 hypothetical protein Gasu2_67360 [Galdieria sulphuraria]|eukprot:XP_005709307.1 hypothetical protein Gasu_01470 [Galdieria sulphuraria]